MTRFGRARGLSMFADWTDRIAAGAVPEAPPRPTGLERNIVVSLWDWGGGRFIHDASSTDKRNPTVHGGGEVFGVQQLSGMVATLNPRTSEIGEFQLEGLVGDWNPNANDHTSTIDEKDRYWMSNTGAVEGENHDYFTDGDLSPCAALYPKTARGGQLIQVFDPETKTNEAIPATPAVWTSILMALHGWPMAPARSDVLIAANAKSLRVRAHTVSIAQRVGRSTTRQVQKWREQTSALIIFIRRSWITLILRGWEEGRPSFPEVSPMNSWHSIRRPKSSFTSAFPTQWAFTRAG